MNFVDDIYFIAYFRRGKFHFIANVANFINP